MPTTLTLKNIPDTVYERLKASAQKHRRSMNSEAIVCLESVLLPTRMAPSERLARARELRASLPQGKFSARDIDTMKRQREFVALALKLDTRLVTMDKKLLRAFPKRAVALSGG